MIGLVILPVLILLVLAVAFLRLGAAAGYDETGGWVKVRVGPAWLTLYPLSEEKKRKRETGMMVTSPAVMGWPTTVLASTASLIFWMVSAINSLTG